MRAEVLAAKNRNWFQLRVKCLTFIPDDYTYQKKRLLEDHYERKKIINQIFSIKRQLQQINMNIAYIRTFLPQGKKFLNAHLARAHFLASHTKFAFNTELKYI